MTIIASVEEINRVLECINPKFPKQNLASLKTNECFYIMNEVPVRILLQEDIKK